MATSRFSRPLSLIAAFITLVGSNSARDQQVARYPPSSPRTREESEILARLARLDILVAQDNLQQAEREEFARVVMQNAEDPFGLEIVQWEYDKRIGMDKNPQRDIKFRCRLVGHKQVWARPYRLGRQPPPPVRRIPVTLEEARISYRDGKIDRVLLYETEQIWYPR